jgi:hypothetical protein
MALALAALGGGALSADRALGAPWRRLRQTLLPAG